jgi:broad specificity phosphatase PhoE
VINLLIYYLFINMIKTIYLSRHGQSLNNTKKLIGGNSGLSSDGKQYSYKLHQYFKNNNINVNVITSNLIRTIQTAKYFNETTQFEELNEINSGICDSMTYLEIENKYPEEFNKRKTNKYYYRYPEGESYSDINSRLKKIYNLINDTETDLLIIAHQAVLRVLISNYIYSDIKDIPYLDVSLNTIYKIIIEENSCKLEIINSI